MSTQLARCANVQHAGCKTTACPPMPLPSHLRLQVLCSMSRRTCAGKTGAPEERQGTPERPSVAEHDLAGAAGHLSARVEDSRARLSQRVHLARRRRAHRAVGQHFHDRLRAAQRPRSPRCAVGTAARAAARARPAARRGTANVKVELEGSWPEPRHAAWPAP